MRTQVNHPTYCPALSDSFAVPPGTPHLLAISAIGKAKREPLLRLIGDQCPTVDIFITYCGEELDVLLDTVRATTALDYPTDRYRIVVLDDSVSPTVKTEVEKLSFQAQNLYYTTRGTRPKTHTKAGNLNHGLKYVSNLPTGASELVAVLDVDMIPSQHWLRALVPHILVNPKVALANPSQRHYNILDGDPLGSAVNIVYDVLEPLKNAINSAWCSGTGFIVRREALDGIGGVPEISMSEDIMTSIFLSAAGWKIVYVHEDVQWGLAPSTIRSHLKQHKRMLAGTMATATIAWSPQAQNMTTEAIYGSMFACFAHPASVVINLITMTALPLLLLTGAPLVVYSSELQFQRLVLLFLIKFLAIFSYDFLATRAANYHLSLLGMSMNWLIPYQFWTIVRFILSSLTGGRVPFFTPSGLTDIRTSKSILGRMKVALWDDGLIIQPMIIAFTIVGVVSSVNIAFQAVDAQNALTQFLIRAGWPPVLLLWSTFLMDSWTPLSYALNYPEQVERRTLVEHDSTTQLAYPTQRAKDQRRIRPSQRCAIVQISHCIGACAFLMFYM